MSDHTKDNHAQEPPRKRRRPRPNGRWTNPASPLQAARFARRLSGKEVVRQIRAICEGHHGRACHLDISKLSDYETLNRRPGHEHITAFCKFYQMSPEALGLIQWRDTPPPRSATGAEADQEQLVTDWLLRSAVAVASVVMKALADYPYPAAPAAGSDPPDEDPPGEEPPPQSAGTG